LEDNKETDLAELGKHFMKTGMHNFGSPSRHGDEILYDDA